MIEGQLFNLVTGNLVGVVFGLLMYKMATTSIKDNTEALHELVILIRELKERKK